MASDYDNLQIRYRQLQLQKKGAWEKREHLRQAYEAAHEAYLSISRQENEAMIAVGEANEARGGWRPWQFAPSVEQPRKKNPFSRYFKRS